MRARIRNFEPVHSGSLGEPWLKVLTYNVLAQALIRREQYPTNGSSIKFANRFGALKEEVLTYAPDIIFLQEVDEDKIPVWKEILSEINLSCTAVCHEQKRHGLLMGWNTQKFRNIDVETISYDAPPQDSLSIPQQTPTGNMGAIMTLVRIEDGHKFVAGTTHLYWHAHACYERSRQVAIFGYELLKMKKKYDASTLIIGGDFNSNPASPGYSFLKNGFRFDAAAAAIIRRSSKHADFGRIGATETEKRLSLLTDAEECVSTLLSEAERVSGPELRSCYNVHGKEPEFTNWTDDFRDVIDYIFVSTDLTPIKILALPTKEDLGEEPSSLPRARDGEGYPSDHLPLAVELV